MRPMQQRAITRLFAGVPVSNLRASIDWYTRFFGRPPDMRAGEEILWEVDEHATLFIEPIEAYSNGVRHANVSDPDGNAIAFAEPPDAASASARSAGPGASSKTADRQRRQQRPQPFSTCRSTGISPGPDFARPCRSQKRDTRPR
jgi:hypothetical protein